jgi:hypothetical protein
MQWAGLSMQPPFLIDEDVHAVHRVCGGGLFCLTMVCSAVQHRGSWYSSLLERCLFLLLLKMESQHNTHQGSRCKQQQLESSLTIHTPCRSIYCA